MTLPLILLSVGAIAAGWWSWGKEFHHFVEAAVPAEALHEAPDFSYGIAISSTIIALAGIATAWAIYHRQLVPTREIRRTAFPIALILERKFFLDDLYERAFATQIFQRGWNNLVERFDRDVVDGAVNGVGWAGSRSSSVLRHIQTGQLQLYGARPRRRGLRRNHHRLHRESALGGWRGTDRSRVLAGRRRRFWRCCCRRSRPSTPSGSPSSARSRRSPFRSGSSSNSTQMPVASSSSTARPGSRRPRSRFSTSLAVDGLSLPLVVLTTFLTTASVLVSFSIEEAPARLLRQPDAALNRGAGRLHRDGLPPLLPLLGARALPDVPAHLRLGLRAEGVFGDEVRALHGRGLGPSCWSRSSPSPSARTRSTSPCSGSPASTGAVLPLSWIFLFLFIGFAVKLPIVPLHTWLPRRPQRRAHGRFGDARGRPAEDGRLRDHPDVRHDPSPAGGRFRYLAGRHWRRQRSLRRLRHVPADGREAPDRVLLGEPYGPGSAWGSALSAARPWLAPPIRCSRTD